jgi:hypothetical protein
MATKPEEHARKHEPVKATGWLNRTVAGAGITSALGDFCCETTTVTPPGFMAVLGIPAAALGFIEGLADAVASFTTGSRRPAAESAQASGATALRSLRGLYWRRARSGGQPT